jgi:PIN domain nuclease of toxin-antitoxin system
VKLLLDTHIWLWSLLEPARLGERVVRELEEPSNELWLSPITTWEALLLVEKGRIVLSVEPAAWIRTALRTLPFREAPLTHEVAIQSRRMGLPHRDPADALLAATAAVFELTLVTADERLLDSTRYSVMPNR